jgi:tripartite ATP-independent transporter DctM subunit
VIYFLIAVILIIFALLGMPLFAVILAIAMLATAMSGYDLTVVASEVYRIANTPLLVALPLFTFAGYLLNGSRAPQRLVNLTQALLGWVPGGLAIVAFVACALLTAFTGASGVTIVALGALLFPALRQARYPESFSLGLVTSSGSLGLLLPPSIPLIIYFIIAQQMGVETVTIRALFLAGILPTLLMIVLLSGWGLWTNRRQPIPTTPFSGARALRAIRDAAWELPLPVVVLGGIYKGFLAVSDVAAITAIYVLVVEVFIHREIGFRALANIMRESMVMVGGIILIMAAALAVSNMIIDAEVPTRLFNVIQAHVSSKFMFLILLNLFLLVLGALIDIFSAIVIMVPIILPVALGYGIDPIHLGIIFLANMEIGYITPPVGMNLFVASYRFARPVDSLYKAAFPFMVVLFIAVLIITYWPWLSLVFV